MPNYILVGSKKNKRGAIVYHVCRVYTKLPSKYEIDADMQWYKSKYNYDQVFVYSKTFY